jgi:dihydroorotase
MALREAVVDGTIDIIATDHAPHPREDKDCEWAAAAIGMIGLETALPIASQVFIESGLMDWRALGERLSVAPARIGRVADQGAVIEVGAPANLVVWDPSQSTVVTPAMFESKSANSPYLGRSFAGTVRHVIFRGRPTVVSGEVVS